MEPIIKVDNVSMCFNLSKEKHESLKEYFWPWCRAVCSTTNFTPSRT